MGRGSPASSAGLAVGSVLVPVVEDAAHFLELAVDSWC